MACCLRVFSLPSPSLNTDLSESDSKGSVVSNIKTDIYGLWEGEDRGAFVKYETIDLGSFYKGLP